MENGARATRNSLRQRHGVVYIVSALYTYTYKLLYTCPVSTQRALFVVCVA